MILKENTGYIITDYTMTRTKTIREIENACREVIRIIEIHEGLAIFCRNRAKFEGWFKVELLNQLEHLEPSPEIDRHDIVFDNCAIELKTVNTSYRYDSAIPKTRPITKNIEGIINDINKLSDDINYEHKVVIFIAFPVEHEKNEWKRHLKIIRNRVTNTIPNKFEFKNKLPGVLYICVVS